MFQAFAWHLDAGCIDLDDIAGFLSNLLCYGKIAGDA